MSIDVHQALAELQDTDPEPDSDVGKTEVVAAETKTTAKVAEPAKPSVTKPSVREQLSENLNPRRHPVIVGMTVLCLAALVAAAVFGVLAYRSSKDLTAAENLTADKQSAERVAGDYAVGAATFDFKDLAPWSAALKKGTAPELASRFDVAVKTLTPLIQQVQWSQTAKLIAAKTIDVRADRQFVVQVFVSTHMTSTQNPNGLNTVTPYTITLDRDDNWLITDVAGIAGVAQDGSNGAGTPNLAPNDAASSNNSPTATTPATPTP
ncbi:serine/threonine protein kinase [Gordonia sp. ABSL49_1]|uniref:serine/threonine protein kinase n=1 Tax=Gordonia sp. ABSL49_1 TaxID=2920941 RepID=UPI001F0E94BF|nr:serine/threonine protein kinase [Gordonia sp. ABSL49_1]MCH5644969.1 serine/threonine protein kinase [Gordonia sp. ABSL49_1]